MTDPIVPWTPERDEIMIALMKRGESAAEIARAMGTTKNAVIGRYRRLGVDFGPPFSTMKDRLAAGVQFPRKGCCVWPHGDVFKPGFHFCGARVKRIKDVDVPYCSEHLAIAWKPRKDDGPTTSRTVR